MVVKSKNKKQLLAFLKKLRNSNRVVRLVNTHINNKDKVYAVFDRGQTDKKLKVNILEEIVMECLKYDYLEVSSDGYIISNTGLAWVKRQLAQEAPFKEQHTPFKYRMFDTHTNRPQMLKVNEADTPLQWLRKRKDRKGRPLIEEYHYQAGERLRMDYLCAKQTNITTSNWSEETMRNRADKNTIDGEGNVELWNKIIAAKDRFNQALEAVGPEMSKLIIDVCCLAKKLEEAEKSEGWPQRSGKVVLQIALTRLARHYGYITPVDTDRTKQTCLLHWGTEDFQPKT